MPRNGAGIYVLPTGNPVVPFTIITTSWANPTMTDLGQALTESIAANGVTTPSANLPMGGFRHTGVGLATSPTHYAAASQDQSGEFHNLTLVTNVGDDYSATLPFNSGGAVPNTMHQAIVWTPSANNVGAATLALNGGVARAILTPLGTPTVLGSIRGGVPGTLIFNGSAWVQTGAGGAGVNSVSTNDPQTLTSSQPTPGNTLLTTNTNVSNGLTKLDAAGKVPVTLLPVEGLSLLGVFDAAPGNLPPVGTLSGQYYVVNPGGNLNLYVTDGAGGWVQQVVPVDAGDILLWVDSTVQPTGWYRVLRANANTAAAIINIATPSFAATDLQAWIDQADASSGFVLAGGGRPFTGQVIAPWVSGFTALGVNAKFDGAWKSIVAGSYSYTTSPSPGIGVTEYISSVQPTLPDEPLTLVATRETSPDYNAFLLPLLGVGGAPRSPGGQAYHLDVYGSGTRRLNISELSGGTAIKIIAAPTGTFIDNVRQNADGSGWNVAGVPLQIRGNGSNGGLRTYLTINNDGYIQVGDNAQTNAGAIVSTYKTFGAVNVAISLVNLQAIGVNAGSNLSAGIAMSEGQVARIIVFGSGSITLPASVKLPKGGAQYGTAHTIIGLVVANTLMFATFTPYDV